MIKPINDGFEFGFFQNIKPKTVKRHCFHGNLNVTSIITG